MLGVIQHIAEQKHLAHIKHRHLDGDAAGIQRAFLRTAPQHHICHGCAGRILIMGEQNDLCAGCLGRAQRFQHIAGRAGIGDKEHHILRAHQAGSQDLQMTVPCGAELIGQAGKAGADIVGQQHTAALTQAEHLPRRTHQIHSLLHGFGRKRILGAVDGSEKQAAGVLTQAGGGSARLRLMLVDQRTGGVGLRQRNAHLMVALKAQCPAEAEHRCLCHLAFPRKGGNGKVLCLVGMVDKVICHSTAGFCQFILPLLQQLPEVCGRRHDGLLFPAPFPAGRAGLTRQHHCREVFL